jgi:translation initiation factor IF-3
LSRGQFHRDWHNPLALSQQFPRLTPHIEEHDLETKKQQSQRILNAGDSVLLVVRIQGKEGVAAKKLLKQMIADLKPVSRPKTGIQLSGKQAVVQLDPL